MAQALMERFAIVLPTVALFISDRPEARSAS